VEQRGEGGRHERSLGFSMNVVAYIMPMTCRMMKESCPSHERTKLFEQAVSSSEPDPDYLAAHEHGGYIVYSDDHQETELFQAQAQTVP
jgi:hypothetical protein